MIDLNQLAESKADNQYSTETWFEVLTALSDQQVFGGFTDGEIQRIIKAASTPAALLNFLEFIHHTSMQSKEQVFDHLMEEIDKYHFELTFWIDALVSTVAWLNRNKKTADFKKIIAFIGQCAKNAMAESADKNLSAHVQKTLKEPGTF